MASTTTDTDIQDSPPGPAEAFTRELVDGHMDRMAQSYIQRRPLLPRDELSWTVLRQLEERQEAHLDALLLSGEAALARCIRRQEEKSGGGLYTLVRLLCRHGRTDLVLNLIQVLDPSDHRRIRETTDALKHESSPAMDRFFTDLAAREPASHPMAPHIGVQLAAGRRLDVRDRLLGLLEQALPWNPSGLFHAAGRVTGNLPPKAAGILTAALDTGDGVACLSAALSLLRMGHGEVLRRCVDSLTTGAWAAVCLGIAGCRVHLDPLAKAVASGADRSHLLTALGFLGDIRAVPCMLPCLEEDGLSGHAAACLDLLTGARVEEEDAMPPDRDEEAVVGGEKALLDAGKASRFWVKDRTRGIRSPGGPLEWRVWWRLNRHRFREDVRYRCVVPVTPPSLFGMLLSDTTPQSFRGLAAEELVIRYGMDVPFETDMPVDRQRSALEALGKTVASDGHRFHPGRWYLAGREQAGQ